MGCKNTGLRPIGAMTALTDSLEFPMLRRNSAPEPAQCRGPSRQSQRCDLLQGSPRLRSTRPGGLGGLSGLLLTSADGAYKMRPVGVRTDVEPLLMHPPRPNVRGSHRVQQQGLRRFCAGRQGASASGPAWAAPEKHRPPSTRGRAVQPVGEGLGKTRGSKVTTSPALSESPPLGTLGRKTGRGVTVCCHPWGSFGA